MLFTATLTMLHYFVFCLFGCSCQVVSNIAVIDWKDSSPK